MIFPVSEMQHDHRQTGLPGNQKGYVLYTVLIIVSVCSILFVTSLYAIRSAYLTSSTQEQQIQARILAESGIVRTEYFLNGGDGHTKEWETDSYTEQLNGYGSITIVCRRFGLFSLVHSIGVRRTVRDTISGLAGRIAPKQLSHTLVLTNKSGGCLVKGNTTIQGTIILDHGYMTDKPHGRRPLPEYAKMLFTRASPPVPFDSLEIKNTVSKLIRTMQIDLQAPSRISGTYNFVNPADSLFSSGSAIVIDGDCSIDCSIRDATISARGTVTLTHRSQCTNVTLSAGAITFDDGSGSRHSLFFSQRGILLSGGIHSSQFISTDSVIIMGKISFGPANCVVSYRSARKDSTLGGGIYIRSNTKLRGTFISCISPDYKGFNLRPAGPSITIEPGSIIKGYVLTDNDVKVKMASIEGTLWARSVVAYDDSILYTNALIGMNLTGTREPVVFPLLGEKPITVIID